MIKIRTLPITIPERVRGLIKFSRLPMPSNTGHYSRQVAKTPSSELLFFTFAVLSGIREPCHFRNISQKLNISVTNK